MTLRVTLEIVPGGVESNKRTIHTIDISNIGTTRFHQEYGEECEYSIIHNGTALTETVKHFRNDGASILVQAVLDFVDD